MSTYNFIFIILTSYFFFQYFLICQLYSSLSMGFCIFYINKKMMQYSNCCICLGDIAYTSHTCVLKICRHKFHTVCLQTWLLHHDSCPLCRNTEVKCQHEIHEAGILEKVLHVARRLLRAVESSVNQIVIVNHAEHKLLRPIIAVATVLAVINFIVQLRIFI